MFTNLSYRFVQICAKQTLSNFMRAFSNVQSKPLTSVDIADKKCRKNDACREMKVKQLMQMLQMQETQAMDIVSKSDRFSKISSNCIGKNYSLCLSSGITSATLQKHPDILAEANLVYKVELVKKLPYALDQTAPLLSIPTMLFEKFILEEDAPRRIGFLTDLFNVTSKQACEWISKRPFLITLREEQMKDVIEILSDFGVDKTEITKDFWVLKYSKSAVKSRLTKAQINNIDKLKTWMVRAKPEIFENYLRRRSEHKSILGNHSLVEYLCSKLGCDKEIAEYIILKLPALQHKSLKKLDSNIDYLLANGFTSTQICNNPKILLHSVETIKKRMEELKVIGKQPDFLSVLMRSQKQFEQFYQNLKAGKTRIKLTDN